MALQIPSSWKPVLEDPSTLQIFFDYYAITKAPLSKEVCTTYLIFGDIMIPNLRSNEFYQLFINKVLAGKLFFVYWVLVSFETWLKVTCL